MTQAETIAYLEELGFEAQAVDAASIAFAQNLLTAEVWRIQKLLREKGLPDVAEAIGSGRHRNK